MTALFLVCHEPLGSALHSVICHGYGRALDDIQVYDVWPGATPTEIAAGLRLLWQASGEPQEALIFTDLLGATPANGAALWIREGRQAPRVCSALSGVNLPMLLRAVTHQSRPAAELADELLSCQRSGACRLDF